MTDKFLKEIREKISCPQFGDDHYGEWGILNVNQRRTIKRLIDYMDGQEAYIKNQQAEILHRKRVTTMQNELKPCPHCGADMRKEGADNGKV